MPDPRQDQVDRNYEAFQAMLASLVVTHPGKFALMRDGEVIELFDTARDAQVAGKRLFPQDGLFSIQQVVAVPVDLGFFSHAVPQR